MKKFSFIFLLLFIGSVSHAETPNDIKEISNKIAGLEGQKENIKNQFDALEKNNEKKWDLMKESNDSKITDLKNRYEWFWGFLLLIAALSGGGLWTIFTNMKKYFDEMFKEKMSKIFDDEKEKLMQLIQNQDVELMLKMEKKILFLSLNENETNMIKQFVSKLDFNKNTYQIIDSNYNFAALNEYNIIVINNAKEGFSTELLSQTLESVTAYNSLVVYFGKYKGILDQYQNINFANSEFTLYSRIMETLKIQYIITKNKNR